MASQLAALSASEWDKLKKTPIADDSHKKAIAAIAPETCSFGECCDVLKAETGNFKTYTDETTAMETAIIRIATKLGTMPGAGSATGSAPAVSEKRKMLEGKLKLVNMLLKNADGEKRTMLEGKLKLINLLLKSA